MQANEIFALQEDMNKLKSLYMELAQHEMFNPYGSKELSDMPKGNGAKNFLDWYVEEKERIQADIDFYKKKIQKDRKVINAFINDAPYPVSDIIRFRVINNLGWEEIGNIVGYSKRHASKKFWEYIKMTEMPQISSENCDMIYSVK